MDVYRVMAADDEPSVIEGLQVMIDWEKYGFELAATAEDGAEALKLIRELKPELAILDICMGKPSGIDITKILRDENIDCHVMILTAYGDIEYARECLKFGVKHYAIKPIDTDEFHTALSDYKHILDKKYGNRRILETAKKGGTDTYKNQFIVAVKHDKSSGIANIDDNYSIFDCVGGIISYLVHTDENIESAANKFFALLKKIDSNAIGCYAYGDAPEQCSRSAVNFLTRLLNTEPGKLYMAEQTENNSISAADFGRYAERINESIGFKDLDAVTETIDEFFAVLQKSDKPLQYVKMFYAYVIIYLYREAVRHNADWQLLINAGLRAPEDLCCLSDYYHILISVCRTVIGYDSGENTEETESTIDLVERYLKEHFREQIVIRELAGMIYTSPGYLGTMFIKNKGMSIKEYIHGLRLEEAVRLINEKPEMSMLDIANEVGYNNYNYFFLQFEKRFGMTPIEYKKLFQK